MSPDLVTAVSSVGFPIIACCAMAAYVAKEFSKMSVTITETMNRLASTVDRMDAKLDVLEQIHQEIEDKK